MRLHGHDAQHEFVQLANLVTQEDCPLEEWRTKTGMSGVA
jgi:hypothetical protein